MVQRDFLSYADMTVGDSCGRWFNFYLLKFPKKTVNFFAKHRIFVVLLQWERNGTIIITSLVL